MNNPGVVYFIYCRLANAVKIGRTRNVHMRFDSIQTHHPTSLELLGAVRGQSRETEFHLRFDHLRIRGEWFEYRGELEQFLIASGFAPNALQTPGQE